MAAHQCQSGSPVNGLDPDGDTRRQDKPRGPDGGQGEHQGFIAALLVMAASFPISPSIRMMPGTSPRLLEYQIETLERMTLPEGDGRASPRHFGIGPGWLSAYGNARGRGILRSAIVRSSFSGVG